MPKTTRATFPGTMMFDFSTPELYDPFKGGTTLQCIVFGTVVGSGNNHRFLECADAKMIKCKMISSCRYLADICESNQSTVVSLLLRIRVEVLK